jgi:hypothetical protein
MAAAGWQLINKPDDITITSHFIEVGISVRDFLLRFIFGLAVLPYEAYKYTDAIVRTNWRMIFTRRKLLEWTPSAAASHIRHDNVAAAYGSMWISPLVSIVSIVWMVQTNAEALYVAAPILILWFFAPALAWRLSRDETEKKPRLSQAQNIFLCKSARRTWSFFEQFVTEEENWLPPDNFQEEPSPVIAHRTSPTNMGLALLANLAAFDFGYITGGDLAARCNNTLQSMLKLERFKGHFFNWYDTISLLPMQPRYISTVDSGNLVGHLLTLRQGLLSQSSQPIFTWNSYHGLISTVKIIQDISKSGDAKQTEKILAALNVAIDEGANSLYTINKQLHELTSLTNQLSGYAAERETELKKWITKLSLQIKSIHDELLQLAPWIDISPLPENFDKLSSIDNIPTLISIQDMPHSILPHIDFYEQQENNAKYKDWLNKMRKCICAGSRQGGRKNQIIESISRTMRRT